MAKNTTFAEGLDPMASHKSLSLDKQRVHGPFSFLHPTQARYHHVVAPKKPTASPSGPPSELSGQTENDDEDGNGQQASKEKATEAPDVPATAVAYKWTSRNNRKGRHALVMSPAASDDPNAQYAVPESTLKLRTILHTIWLMIVYYPVWDVSWWVAWIFSLGSVVWVINGFFSFLPDIAPSTEFTGEVTLGGGITAFIGATIFVVGSILLIIEANNENRAACFGWAVEQAYEEYGSPGTDAASKEKGAGQLHLRPSTSKCLHHHQNSNNFVGKAQAAAMEQSENGDGAQDWVWWPSPNDFRTRYMHSLGWWASFVQLLAASIFWISGFTALPGIYGKLTTTASLDGWYWFPQTLGGSGFIISGTLFMIETQKHWWLPAPLEIGWHIGFWNLIGGFGFTLCPAFGYDTASWAQYQASCSTFWGSWAFLIGSLLQLYESLEKHPVEIDKDLGKENEAD